MKQIFKGLFCIFCLIVCGCNGKVGLSAEGKIEKSILTYKKKWDYKLGICVAVYSPSLDLSYNFADGYFSLVSKEKITSDTLHILYSITKSFTASSIVKLINEGKLSYDSKVSDYLTGLNEIYIYKYRCDYFRTSFT